VAALGARQDLATDAVLSGEYFLYKSFLNEGFLNDEIY
jgi:hypothetical protein